MNEGEDRDHPPPFPADRPGAATVRSKLMLEVASTLVGRADWPARQVRIDLRPQGVDTWDVTLFASDGIDGVAEVAAGRAHFAILNPATAIASAWAEVAGAGSPAAIATIPSHDQLGLAVHADHGLDRLEQLPVAKPPLRLSLRGHRPNHSVHLVVADVLSAVGVAVDDIEAWGGTVRYDEGHVHGPIRSAAMANGEIDAAFDEGIYNWVDLAVAGGMRFLAVGEETFGLLQRLGYRRSTLRRTRYPSLEADVPVLDFSGFLVYTHHDTPDDLVEAFCSSLETGRERIPWQGGPSIPLARMVADAVDAPLPIPFHPAAERYWRRCGLLGDGPLR